MSLVLFILIPCPPLRDPPHPQDQLSRTNALLTEIGKVLRARTAVNPVEIEAKSGISLIL